MGQEDKKAIRAGNAWWTKSNDHNNKRQIGLVCKQP